MSHLSCAWIDLYEVCTSRVSFQHEIKPVQPRKIEPSDHLLGGGTHFWVIDQAHHAGGSGRIPLVEHFKIKTGQHRSLPAGDGAGGFSAADKFLCIHH